MWAVSRSCVMAFRFLIVQRIDRARGVVEHASLHQEANDALGDRFGQLFNLGVARWWGLNKDRLGPSCAWDVDAVPDG
jgi:hypothetical protein